MEVFALCLLMHISAVYAYLFVYRLLLSLRYFYPIPPPPMRRVCERAPQPMRVHIHDAPCSQINTARPSLENQTHAFCIFGVFPDL